MGCNFIIEYLLFYFDLKFEFCYYQFIEYQIIRTDKPVKQMFIKLSVHIQSTKYSGYLVLLGGNRGFHKGKEFFSTNRRIHYLFLFFLLI